MPIEIRELVIKTSVSGGSQSSGTSASSPSSASDSAAIVAECVDQVLAVLRDKVER